MKIHKYLSPILATLVLTTFLSVKTSKGIDFSDEIQYYGQIKGLLDSGSLFSNDLFIQQLVYLLFYPFFYFYHMAFGYEGFIFFGRLLLAILTFTVFLFSYRAFLRLSFKPFIASTVALSMTFAIDHHNLFALSYNTVSQCLWIIFLIKFYEWKRDNIFFWSIIPIIEALVHPISAIIMSLLVFVRLILKSEYKKILYIYFFSVIITIATFPFLLSASPLQGYLSSVLFSSGYGIGTGFFTGMRGQVFLTSIWLMFLAIYLFRNYFYKINFNYIWYSSILIAIIIIDKKYAGSVQDATVLLLSPLCALVYAWILSKPNINGLHEKVHWLVIAFLIYGSTIAITSGVGFRQMVGACMVVLPFMLGLAVFQDIDQFKKRIHSFFSLSLLIVLFILNTIKFPFSNDTYSDSNQPILSVPEFKFISTSSEKIFFINYFQNELKTIIEGRNLLIVSDIPALYFILQAREETCMYYLHILGSERSQSELMTCLNKKSPEIILFVSSKIEKNPEILRLHKVMEQYALKKGFNISKTGHFSSNSFAEGDSMQLDYKIWE